MKKWLFLSLLSLFALTAAGAEFEINSGTFHVIFDTVGGGVKSIKRARQEYNYPGKSTFTERFFAPQEDKLLFERFAALEFNLDKFAQEKNQDIRVILSAGGISSFDWLRVTKNYFFPRNKNFFTVTYTLKNRSDKVQNAAMWFQTYLGPADESGARVKVLQPRNGKLFELSNPGNATANEWSATPGAAVAAVCGKEDPAGFMLSLPGTAVASYYTWTGNKKGKPIHSLELQTRQWTIQPGAEVSFTIQADYDKNIIPKAVAQVKKAAHIIPASTPRSLALPGKTAMKYLEPKGGATADPQRFVEIKLKRQFLPSVRGVIIPAKEKFTSAAVFPVSNGRIDRDRPFKSVVKDMPDGSKRLLFEVPGIAPNGFYYTVVKEGFAWDNLGGPKYMRPLGKIDLTCHVVLDAPVTAPLLKADAPELMYNGDLEKADAKGKFADGNVWHHNTLKRNVVFWEKGAGKEGSYGIKLKQGNQKYHSGFTAWFFAEAGLKYNISADICSENPDRKYTLFSTSTLDEKRKQIEGPTRKVIKTARTSYPWTRAKGFNVPTAEGHYLVVHFGLQAKSRDNFMQIDNVSVVPEDFHFTPKDPLAVARENAVLSGYLPLANLEKISHAYVTPHEKWFTPLAAEKPKFLYACSIIGSNEDASRREIVELAQRMELDYDFIPVLPKILGIAGNGSFGVNKSTLDKNLDQYTIERFKALKSAPKLLLLQGVNFKEIDAKGALAAEVAKLQAKGTQVIFLNCMTIPKKLLGKKAALPASWQIIPLFRPLKNLGNYCQNYKNNAAFSFGNAHYVKLSAFPSTPVEYAAQDSPAFTGRDFPFWEYRYLPLMKAILERSGAVMPLQLQGIVEKNNALEFDLEVKVPGAYTFETLFKAMNREINGKMNSVQNLKAGRQKVLLPLPHLPGGTSIAHCRILTAKGAVAEAGAIKIDRPSTASIKVAFTAPDRCYSFKAPVTFSLQSSKFLPGDKISVRIEDTEFREVYRNEYNAVNEKAFAVTLLPPHTTLNRILAEIRRDGKIIERAMGDFSLSDRRLDPTDYHAGMWGGRPLLTGMLRNLGFDLFSTSATRDTVSSGYLRNLLNLGYFPLVLNFGHVGVPRERSRTYRSDVVTDPVRNPCYSDPAFRAVADAAIKKYADLNKMRYYTCVYHQLGDEMFLGSTVCFSVHCLKNFRAEMQKQYKTIANLNAVWGRNYKSFDEVTPVQRKEVENSSNLAPWLDHKVFMSKVYAERFIGARAETIQKYIPGAKVGMSGTQVPGYGYDWWQLMKHIGCIAYYSGVQRALVNDFAPVERLTGQWGGGYTSSHALYEAYQRSPQWSNLFMGANTSWNWHGSAYNGDGSPTANLAAYADEFNLLKKGLGKLLLSAGTDQRQVAVLYSQASLFAAMAGGIGISEWQNTQTGWNALLRDLKIDFRFISYENLADEKFSLDNLKVIILPMALAISEAERNRLAAFAQKGGVVIADIAPGRYDNHGKRISGTVLDKLFPANPEAIAPQTMQLNKAQLQGAFRIAEPKLPVCVETPCGKGKGVLLNIMLNSYQAVSLGGVGGETATSKSGSALYCDSMQKTLKALLAGAKIAPHAVVTDAKGSLVPSESVLKKDGCNTFFGLLRGTGGRAGIGKIDHAKAPVVTVKLPVSGVIYDVRTGKMLGKGNTFSVKAPFGYGQLFSVLPAEVKAPVVKAPAQVKAGVPVTVTVSAPGAQGPTVYRLEVRDPATEELRFYAKNTRFATPEGSFTFQLPFNAAPGKWQISCIHVASQQKKAITLLVVK